MATSAKGEEGKARAVCLFEFSPVGFCALPVVVNFSASLCCHVLFPVDHALLLPPPTLLTSVSSLLSHTPLFVWVCTDGRELPQRPPDWPAAEGL